MRFTRTGARVPPLAPDRPLALVLDDAHFLDPSAIDDMARLLDELGSDAVLVLMTFRLGFHRAGSAEMRALARFVRDPRTLKLVKRELACALAVAEEPLSARAADALAADVDAAWSALIDAGLAETDGAGMWLRHALVGEAISSRLGPMEFERWHGLLAAALEAERADPDRVAGHCGGGSLLSSGRPAGPRRSDGPRSDVRLPPGQAAGSHPG